MRKFKLIKEYPGSPKVESIFEYWTDGISEQIYDGKKFIPLKVVKDYPEFWEEVVEKDYDILTLISKSKKHIISYEQGTISNESSFKYKPEKSFDCYKNKDHFIQAFLNSTEWNIYSVKRLSDGEVFTIGDICYPNGYLTNKLPIKKIWFCDPGYLRISSDNYTIGIRDLVKSKKPLFTTEDGVDIYEGDGDLFSVLIKGSWDTKRTKVNRFLLEGRTDTWLHFKTKEARDEFILMNKPCLSLNDIKEAREKSSINYRYMADEIYQNLKSLVKQKSNL